MKTRVENTIEPLGQDPEKDKFETSRWEPTQQKILLLVDWAVDRQRSNFRPLGKAVDRPVDRRSQAESETLCWSTRRSTGPNREQCSCRRSTARSTEVHACTLVHIGRPPSRPTDRAICSANGRPPCRPAIGQGLKFLE